MAIFKASTKADAGKYLIKVRSDIESKLSSNNHLDTILVLLCLEDAINNLEIQCLAKTKLTTISGEENRDMFVLSYFQLISEWYQVIDNLVDSLAKKNSFVPLKIGPIPEIGFGICIGKGINEHLTTLFEKGILGRRDMIWKKPRIFLNKTLGWFYITLKTGGPKLVFNTIDKILQFRDLCYQRGLLETMLTIAPEGTTVEFDYDTGRREITLPSGVTVESVLENEGISPRRIENHTAVIDWNSTFREVAIETFKVINKGKSTENISKLQDEDEQIYASYNNIKTFSTLFEQFYEIDYKSFFDISSQIMYACYKNTHTIGIWKHNDILKERLLKPFNQRDLLKTIEILSKKSSYLGIICADEYMFTSFRRLVVSRLLILEKCFGKLLDNNFKGDAFEEACRSALVVENWKTIPYRVVINEPTVTPIVAYNLWGELKAKTDIDVIASKNNFIIIAECKEIKDSDLEGYALRHFKRFCFEHYYRAHWIGNNLQSFEKYVGQDLSAALGIDMSKSIFLIPFVVSNKAFGFRELMGTTLISFLEFKDLITKEPQANILDESGTFKIVINNREVILPWMEVKR